MLKINTLLNILSLFVFSIACSSTSIAQVQVSEWRPLSYEKVNVIALDQNLTKIARIIALTQLLDQRISLSDKTKLAPDPDFDRDYDFLIRTIATLNSPVVPSGTEKAIQETIAKLNDLPEIENKDQVRSFLYVALAYAGSKTQEDELIKLLRQSRQFPYISVTILQAFQRSEVSPHALPLLLNLLENSWSYIDQGMDIGPPKPKRIYPIRQEACGALNKLGIECQQTEVTEEQINKDWGMRVKVDEFKVNRVSLLDRLQKWLMSNDSNIWQPTTDIIYQISGKDVKAIIVELLNNVNVSSEKKRALEKNEAA